MNREGSPKNLCPMKSDYGTQYGKWVQSLKKQMFDIQRVPKNRLNGERISKYTYKGLLKDNNIYTYESTRLEYDASKCFSPVRRVYVSVFLNGRFYEKECEFPINIISEDRLDFCINKMYEFIVHQIEGGGYKLKRND